MTSGTESRSISPPASRSGGGFSVVSSITSSPRSPFPEFECEAPAPFMGLRLSLCFTCEVKLKLRRHLSNHIAAAVTNGEKCVTRDCFQRVISEDAKLPERFNYHRRPGAVVVTVFNLERQTQAGRPVVAGQDPNRVDTLRTHLRYQPAWRCAHDLGVQTIRGPAD